MRLSLIMNDFTKEELEEIKRCLKYMIKGGTTPHSNLTIDINKKIQSMIDNYCEHEWENYYVGSIIRGIYCEKCNKHLKGS